VTSEAILIPGNSSAGIGEGHDNQTREEQVGKKTRGNE
jgi:hypothetical protein